MSILINQEYIEELSGRFDETINSFDELLRCVRGINVLSQLNLSNNSEDIESQLLSLKCNMLRIKSTISEQIDSICVKEVNNSKEIDNLTELNI